MQGRQRTVDDPIVPFLQALTRNEIVQIADDLSVAIADQRAKVPVLAALAGAKCMARWFSLLHPMSG